MKFVFIAKHRTIWPVAWLCEAMGVSRSGFHAWLNRSPSARSRSDETVGQQVKASFLASDRTYGARRVWRDLLADGVECGLHRIERLMRLQALRARPRRRRLPKDEGDRQVAQSAACNHFHSLEQRCCRWLLMTHDRMHADEFLLTQEFLAMMLGVQRTGVTAAAGALQRAGLIRYSRGKVTMLDRSGLVRRSCECYGVSKKEFDRLLGKAGKRHT